MATLDEILGGRRSGGGYAPKGSAEWAERNSGENAPASSSAAEAPAQQQSPPARTGGGYEDLFKKLNPYKPPTEEELEKEKKRQKRAQIFAAIGDGVTALSNLYFTTQYAPNMYDGKKTLSESGRVRYDKLVKDRREQGGAYINALLKARQADDEGARQERSWQRQLGLDQEARDRYNEGIAHRNEREKIADERYKNEREYKKGRDQEADRRWQEAFDENRRRSDKDRNLRLKQHNDNISVRKGQARAAAARGVRGKQLGFADGNGNQVSIYENVWKGSMQQVYDAMLSDLAPSDEAERKRWERQMKKIDTPQKKEDYVKQNWHKSPTASQIMLTLSSLDPATMTSELNDEIEDYTPDSEGGDDIIDYTR